MAKRVNRFSCKGELVMAEGLVVETRKDEIVEVDFWSVLREFDGKVVSIVISEETEIGGQEDKEEI